MWWNVINPQKSKKRSSPNSAGRFISLLSLLLLASQPSPTQEGDLSQRIQPERLRSLRHAIYELHRQRKKVPVKCGYNDYRAVIHCHSYLSHDSKGTLEEILSGAGEAGVQVIFMTDHYTEDRTFLHKAFRGKIGGVLFIPGTELSTGLLAFQIDGIPINPQQPLSVQLERLSSAGCLTFLAHCEKITSWPDLKGFLGMEIYNTHADALAGNGKLPRSLSWYFNAYSLFKAYPMETFASIFNPPTKNLEKWDELTQKLRVVGFAGNDSHGNVGIRGVFLEDGRIQIETLTGSPLIRIPMGRIPAELLLGKTPTPGEEAFAIQLDPYGISFRYVSTHLLAKSLEEPFILQALKEGRCYVSFDWLGDPTGFVYIIQGENQKAVMGEVFHLSQRKAKAIIASPLPGTLRLLKDGQEIARDKGYLLEYEITQPGVYRAEVTLTLTGENLPWIYSNPIYVK